MKIHKYKSRQRNPLHNHPLMRKGGLHEKTTKAKRKSLTQKLKKEWCYLIAFRRAQSNNTIQSGSQLKLPSGCSSVWSESSVWNRDVIGSNPIAQTKHFNGDLSLIG